MGHHRALRRPDIRQREPTHRDHLRTHHSRKHSVTMFTSMFRRSMLGASTAITAEVLVVAGGGGGGSTSGPSYGGGGGGAGGVVYTASTTLTAASVYTVTIGAGGAGGVTGASGSAGSNSSFTGLTTAVGGGLGGRGNSASGNGGNGGSGGGGGGNPSTSGGTATSGQGFAGGNPAPTRIRTLGVVVVARLPREDLETQARAQAAQALHTSATRSAAVAVVDV